MSTRLVVVPIPMLLPCPECAIYHIDHDEWTTRLHKTHRCEDCGREWRPSNEYTVGVEELPKVVLT